MAGIAGAIGTFLLAKRQHQEQQRQQQERQQQLAQQQQQADLQRQYLMAQIAHMTKQDTLADREHGIGVAPYPGAQGAPQPTPGIAPGPGGPPPLVAPGRITAQTAGPLMPNAPAPQAAPPQPAKAPDIGTLTAQAAASLKAADDADAEAKYWADNGATVKESEARTRATQARAQAAAIRSMIGTIQSGQTNALNTQVVQGELADRETKRKQEESLRTFESGLQTPKGYGALPPDKKIAYLRNRLIAAQRVGDPKVVQETQAEIARLDSEARDASRDRRDQQRDARSAAHEQFVEKIDLQRLGLEGERVELERTRRSAVTHGADPEAITSAEAMLAKSPDPQATANHLAAYARVSGNAATAEAIKQLGDYYASKKGQRGPTKFGSSSSVNVSKMENSPRFKTLPGGVQSVLLKMARQGVSTAGMAQAIQSSGELKKNPDLMNAALQALGGI